MGFYSLCYISECSWGWWRRYGKLLKCVDIKLDVHSLLMFFLSFVASVGWVYFNHHSRVKMRHYFYLCWVGGWRLVFVLSRCCPASCCLCWSRVAGVDGPKNQHHLSLCCPLAISVGWCWC
jgi:hypothetical protein